MRAGLGGGGGRVGFIERVRASGLGEVMEELASTISRSEISLMSVASCGAQRVQVRQAAGTRE